MAYRVKSGETPSESIPRIICDQADKALAALRAPEDRAEAAHEARKRFKKIRAALRLVRPEIGEKRYAAQNAAWRDAGRLLAGLRDDAAMLETLDLLHEHIHAPEALAVLPRVRAVLEARAAESAERARAGGGMFGAAMEAVTAARKPVADLPIRKKGFGACKKGLKKVYRRGGERGANAFSTGAAADFHDFRKRVKYLWLQLRILHPLAPDEIAPMQDLAKQLADILGDDHDLAELQAILVAEQDSFGGPEPLAPLLAAIAEQSLILRARARPLYDRIYAETPKAFAARIKTYWKAWRAPD